MRRRKKYQTRCEESDIQKKKKNYIVKTKNKKKRKDRDCFKGAICQAWTTQEACLT